MKVKRGDIVYLRRDAYEIIAGKGHLQYGMRPLLVISNDIGNYYSGICVVVPLSTKSKRNLPTHAHLKHNFSAALCEQIFTINQNDIVRIVDSIGEKEQSKVNECLKISLALERG